MTSITKTKFKNANEAYEYLLDAAIVKGVKFDDTVAMFNIGYYIEDPQANHITNKQRNWSCI